MSEKVFYGTPETVADCINTLLSERDRYKHALERIIEHWNGIDGEIGHGLMARIAQEALHG